MFSDRDFIKASRDFVCVRLETYESKEHEQLIRKLYGGKFTNTVFCILAPDGETKLTRVGRSPGMVLSRSRPGAKEDSAPIIESLAGILEDYPRKGSDVLSELQDFNSFKQALNVASSDQRLLIVVTGPKQKSARTALQNVLNSEEMIGRFHLDFLNSEDSQSVSKAIPESRNVSEGIMIVQSDQFGQTGKLLKTLPLTSSVAAIKSALVAANRHYAKIEERKIYNEHVREGRAKEVNYTNVIPYGEDRDGDGKIDAKGAGGKGKGRKGKGRN